MVFGKRLREARWDAHLSLTGLSEKTGVSRSLIMGYEKDKSLPAAYNLYQLATTLDVSMDWLFGRTDRKKVER